MALNLSQYLINNLGTVESTMLAFQYDDYALSEQLSTFG